MRITTVLARILALKQTRIRGVQQEPEGLVLDVTPSTRVPICSWCFKRVRAVHDSYEGRRWRHLDVAGMRLWLRYEIRRVRCPRCGVTVELVPSWAEPRSWFTFDFEQHVAYLAQRADKTTISDTMRIAWAIKGTRFALQKNPWNLSAIEYAKLTLVQWTNRPLYRAYLLKETLARILDGGQVNVARDKLLEWIAWATRSRLPPFRRVARTIKKHLEGIVAYVATGLSSGRSEGLNGKIRTITRRSFGFHSASSLIALIKLCCGGLTLALAHR